MRFYTLAGQFIIKSEDFISNFTGITDNGTNEYKEWHIGGKRHRLDGPARWWSNGYEEWYADDKLHRLGGPALVGNNREYIEPFSELKRWYITGVAYTKEEHDLLYDMMKLKKLI